MYTTQKKRQINNSNMKEKVSFNFFWVVYFLGKLFTYLVSTYMYLALCCCTLCCLCTWIEFCCLLCKYTWYHEQYNLVNLDTSVWISKVPNRSSDSVWGIEYILSSFILGIGSFVGGAIYYIFNLLDPVDWVLQIRVWTRLEIILLQCCFR